MRGDYYFNLPSSVDAPFIFKMRIFRFNFFLIDVKFATLPVGEN